MDELAEVLPNYPRCLHRREFDEGPAGMVWICDCGVSSAEASV